MGNKISQILTYDQSLSGWRQESPF